jgi:hypothetical protein
MGAVRRNRRLFGVLAILALAANVAAGALCHMPARASVIVDDILGVMSLCASDGGSAIQHGGTGPDRKTEGSCTICTLLKAFAVAVALAFAAIVFPIFPAPALRAPGVRTLAQHLSMGAVRSRAPPLPA